MCSAKRTASVPPSELRRAAGALRPFLRGLRRPLLDAALLGLAVTGLTLLAPWPVTWVLGQLVGSNGANTVHIEPVLAIAGVAFAVPGLTGLARQRLQFVITGIGGTSAARIRVEAFEHLDHLDAPEQQFSSNLPVRLMSDIDTIRDQLFQSWLAMLLRSSLLIGGTIIFALVDWRLLNIALLPIPLLVWGARRADALAAQDRAHLSRLIELLVGAGVAGVLLLGAIRARDGLLTPGHLVLAISYTLMFYRSIRKLPGDVAEATTATRCAMRVLHLLARPSGVRSGGAPCASLRGDIEFVDIEHRDHEGRISLSGFSARIASGMLTTVTGEAGPETSALIALLLRRQRPTSGDIVIDGAPIDTYQLDEYREQIAYAPHEVTLFSGTIRENIAVGDSTASLAAVLAAAEDVLLLPLLDRLPDGLDTRLDAGTVAGTHGDDTVLTAAEARCVMLARAAVRRTWIVIINQPLAGLDREARAHVIAAIDNIARDRTTVVVDSSDLSDLQPDERLDLGNRQLPPPSAPHVPIRLPAPARR